MQVEILLSVINMQFLLPAGLPGYETADPSQQEIPGDIGVGACVVVTLPELQLQFRLHEYYMGTLFVNTWHLLLNGTSEMSLNVDTIAVCPEDDCPEADFLSRSHESPKESLVIEGGNPFIFTRLPQCSYPLRN